ncbi:MAG TPA: PadR family transcriptional regulator [Acidimicrobiia bacterium]|nr:PadR family transcriptional regulator [Acidimicrobiia bacterium]
MKRRPGTILPIEEAILSAGLDLRHRGSSEFHGFAIARHMETFGEAHQLTAYGTLYKALGRLEAGGLLESRWEDPDVALAEGRPRRRFYRVTGAGERALAAAILERGHGFKLPRTGLASS